MRDALPLVLTLVVVLGSVAGCASEPVDEPDAVVLELGTGAWRFEPLEDGQRVDLIRGAQGGWHVWTSVRSAGFAPDDALLELETQIADESMPAIETSVQIHLEPLDSMGRRSYIGWPNQLVNPGCLVDQLLRIRATLSDSSGTIATDERMIVPGGGADPPPPCGSTGI